jgi:hypothetical protein
MVLPSLERCLAYVVLSDYPSWLGRPSPRDLELVLAGASARAELTAALIDEWRIYGPLQDPDFYMQLVARTGHPTLSIKWSSALEFLHLDLEAALRELRARLESWDRPLPVMSHHRGLFAVESNRPPPTLHEFLSRLARYPGAFLGSREGWALRCYLHGMLHGGDWLGLPTLDGLREVVQKIESVSCKVYGSPFAGYRACSHDCRLILSWAGIEPSGDERRQMP